MFEVLLQADRALASGALDQAERSYWQLVELDPTNAIAVTGLARVSLERGDTRLARTFAERALTMDPDSTAARRILEALAGGEAIAAEEPDLPLLAAQRLEALGRRRAAVSDDADAASARPDQRSRGRKGAEAPRTTLPQMPNEPLRERRQAGREAAAAAAAAAEAAPRSQPAARAKSHQALGERAHRHLKPDDLRPQPRSEDPFAAAESAAAIEAVDETDDITIAEPVGRTHRPGTKPPGAAIVGIENVDEDESIAMRIALVSDDADIEAAELAAARLDELGATDEDESIAMRLALVSDSARLAAAEADANLQVGIEEADFAAAEADAEAGVASRDGPELYAAELDAAELEAAEAAVVARLGRTDVQVGDADLDAAEMDASILAGRHGRPTGPIDLEAIEAELAAVESRAAGAQATSPGRLPAEAELAAAAELAAVTRPAPRPATGPDEPTEEEAEAAAFREALDLVLASDGGESRSPRAAAASTVTPPLTEAPGPAKAAVTGTTDSETPSEPPATPDEAQEPPDGGQTDDDSQDQSQPRRKGLFRRLRGD
jgi:hypothetical protein